MEIKIFDLLKTLRCGGIFKQLKFLFGPAVVYTVVTALCLDVSAQTCKVISSVPATPPKSGALAILRAAHDYEYYSVQGSRIYDTYDTSGKGPYTQIDTNLYFWKFSNMTVPGPMERCAVWAVGNPLKLGFSVCVNIPEAKTYYMGFGADNSGRLTIDGIRYCKV